MEIVVFLLLIAIFFDIALLKKRDQRLFGEAFAVSPVQIFLSIILVLVFIIFSSDQWSDLPPLILLCILPAYLLKRNRFALAMKDAGDPSLRLRSSALGVIVAWTFGMVVFSLLTSAITDHLPNVISEMGDLIISAVFSSASIIALVYHSSQHFSKQGFLANVGLHKSRHSWAKAILLPVILGLFFAFFSSYLIIVRQVQPQTPLNEIIESTKSLYLILVFLFMAVGVAPLVEEIVFRGYFFHVLKEWIGAQKTIYVIALTFAFLHVGQYWGDWVAIAMVTVLGFTLTLLRAWSGSTVAGVITHYVYNGGVTIIPIIMLAISNPAYMDYKINYSDYDAQTKETLLKESIAEQPDFADAFNDLAWLYAQEEKNLDEALLLVEKALTIAPRQPAYLDTKAAILEELGRSDEARLIRSRLEGKLP